MPKQDILRARAIAPGGIALVAAEGEAYQIEMRVAVSHVDSLALPDDLAHFAPALFCSALVAGRKQLVGADGRGRGGHGLEGEDLQGLGGLFLGETAPDLVDALLRTQLDLFLLLVVRRPAGLQRGPPLELWSASMLLLLLLALVLRFGLIAPAPWCKHFCRAERGKIREMQRCFETDACLIYRAKCIRNARLCRQNRNAVLARWPRRNAITG